MVLSRMRCNLGFKRSKWYGSNRKNEIYNSRVIPELQVSKERDSFNDLYAHFFTKTRWQCKTWHSWFWLNFALIFHQWGDGGMKLDISRLLMLTRDAYFESWGPRGWWVREIGNRGRNRWSLVWGKYVKLRKSAKVVKWVGSGRGCSTLVQNDQRNCRNVFKQVLAKSSWGKLRKT